MKKIDGHVCQDEVERKMGGNSVTKLCYFLKHFSFNKIFVQKQPKYFPTFGANFKMSLFLKKNGPTPASFP